MRANVGCEHRTEPRRNPIFQASPKEKTTSKDNPGEREPRLDLRHCLLSHQRNVAQEEREAKDVLLRAEIADIAESEVIEREREKGWD